MNHAKGRTDVAFALWVQVMRVLQRKYERESNMWPVDCESVGQATTLSINIAFYTQQTP